MTRSARLRASPRHSPAHFTVNKPVKGLDNLAYCWKGAKWKFATAANLEIFKAGSGDGGELFALACGVWRACAALLVMRRGIWLGWPARLSRRPR